ncbi:polysaccharide biosynthesis/export family protein [Sphingomonas sp.]|uniref:polysaccharide biosynthesis/export family protein n=1 Tax=Sphingomonas sp. TaxID=28214 RepID=UPI0031DEB137
MLAIWAWTGAIAHAKSVTGTAPPATQGEGAKIASPDSYRLGTADKVRIIVFNEPTLSGEFIVGDGGQLSLPLIGDVAATGRSAGEVTAEIQRRLADGYLRDPRVSMDVLTYRPFYILGEVSKPGEYPYASGLTVMNAVARAEGFTYRANKKKVFIKHAGEAEEKEVKLSADVTVAPGDTIRIGERYF